MKKSRKHTELVRLIQATLTGDEKAFTELVNSYRHFAYATACSLLKDENLAQDAVQESFLTVYYQLHKLKKIETFPAWLNTIVKFSCYSIFRKQNSMNNVNKTPSRLALSEKSPDELFEEKERYQKVNIALDGLPEKLREVVYLFYIKEHTQEEVAEYLGLRTSTVNNRLFSARKILKRRLFDMVKDTIKSKRLPDDFVDNIGKIIRVQGPIVEVQIGSKNASRLFDSWALADDAENSGPQLTIIQREVSGKLRLINLGDEKHIKVGIKISALEKEPSPIVSDELLKKAISTISPKKAGKLRLYETGIKIIDLMAPLPANGSIGLFGIQGVGRAVSVMELYHRLKNTNNKLNVIYFVSKEEAINLRIMIEREPNFPPDKDEKLETFWLVTSKATDPNYAGSNDILDSSLFFSPLMSCRDLYPAVDGLYSSSQLLQKNIVSEEHLETTKRVREFLRKSRRIIHAPQFLEYVAMGAHTQARQWYHETTGKNDKQVSPEEKIKIARLHKLELFFTQPFYTAESYSEIPGISVSLKDTIDGCKAILDGAVDDIPEEAFAFSGTIEDIKKNAVK